MWKSTLKTNLNTMQSQILRVNFYGSSVKTYSQLAIQHQLPTRYLHVQLLKCGISNWAKE